jgi:hypothetical protein
MIPPFATIQGKLTPAQATVAMQKTTGTDTWEGLLNTCQRLWDSTWNNPSATPDIIVAEMGVGAIAAFTLFADFVAVLTTSASLIGATPEQVAQVASLAVPSDWTVTPGVTDGTMVAAKKV